MTSWPYCVCGPGGPLLWAANRGDLRAAGCCTGTQAAAALIRHDAPVAVQRTQPPGSRQAIATGRAANLVLDIAGVIDVSVRYVVHRLDRGGSIRALGGLDTSRRTCTLFALVHSRRACPRVPLHARWSRDVAAWLYPILDVVSQTV